MVEIIEVIGANAVPLALLIFASGLSITIVLLAIDEFRSRKRE